MSHDDRELMFTPGWRLAEMVAAREVSPVELTEACLRRIDELEPKLHAFLLPGAGVRHGRGSRSRVRSDAGR